MPGQTLTVGQYFKSLRILHFALIVGQVMFGFVAFAVQKTAAFGDDQEMKNILMYVVPIIAVACVVVGNIRYGKRLTQTADKTLPEKLTAYRAALITRGDLLEAPSLFSIIAFLLTGQLVFLAVTGLIVAIFFYVLPSKEKFAKDLALSTDEMFTINDDDNAVDQ